jgi:hypothetical protein
MTVAGMMTSSLPTLIFRDDSCFMTESATWYHVNKQ